MTWSAANKNSHVVLSNGDLTAATDGASTHCAGRAGAGLVIGSGVKRYWEITIDEDGGALANNTGVGIANVSQTFADNEYLGSQANGYGYHSSGEIYFNGSVFATVATFGDGNILSIEVEGGNDLRVRVNGGSWSSDIDISALGDVYPAFNVRSAGEHTANFGGTAFAFTPTSGYTGFTAAAVLSAASGAFAITGTDASLATGADLGELDPPIPGVEYFDTFGPFGSLGSPGDPWVIGVGADPLALEAHLGKDLLLIAEPLEAGTEGSVDLDIFPPFGSLPDGWSSITAERRMIWIAATQGRSTANDDEPPAQYVPGRLQPFNFGARLFEGTDPLARAGANEGVIGLIDPDGSLSDLVGRVWDGTPLTLKRGPRGTPFKDWPVVGRYRAAGLIRDLDQKQIQLRDLGWLLAGALHDETYAGTGGVEGTDAITGRRKPWALGYNFQIEPVLLSGPDQIFQWSLSSSQALLELRHGGIVIDIDADYPSYAALAAATIPPGECATCLALSLVRPNLALQYDMRVDVIGDADVVNGHPAPLTRASIFRRIATSRGQNRVDDDSEIDFSAFGRMESYHTAPVGWYFSDEITKAAALDRVLAGVLGWWRVRPDGRLTVGWVVAPESLPATITITGGRDDVGKPRLMATSAPRRGTRISWQTNNAPQDRSSLSALVSDEDADLYKQPASYAQSLAPAIASTWPTAELVTVDEAGFRDESDAGAEAARQQAIFSIERNRWARDIQIDPFIDLLGSGVGIIDDPLSDGGASIQMCVAIEAVGTSVQTLEFFT